jgi:tRNA(Arg) A34 adenosine deaminase TadA
VEDSDLMREALHEAEATYARGECPVGVVLVQTRQVRARAGNWEVELHDPTAHAKILVLREAGRRLRGPFVQVHLRGNVRLFSTGEAGPDHGGGAQGHLRSVA